MNQIASKLFLSEDLIVGKSFSELIKQPLARQVEN
jgi:hypothetical protein